MAIVVFALVFVLPLTAFVLLHVRAGLSNDPEWSRHQVLGNHGLRLGLAPVEWSRDSAPVAKR